MPLAGADPEPRRVRSHLRGRQALDDVAQPELSVVVDTPAPDAAVVWMPHVCRLPPTMFDHVVWRLT